MAQTASTMLPLGSPAPDFSLREVTSGRTMTLADFRSKRALLVMFICNHCPYVKHLNSALAQLGRDYAASDMGIVAIGSNDASAYPDDSPEALAGQAREMGFVFPYLYDADQSVAKAYRAACTPDFFVFDGERKLAYRGRFDASRPKNDLPVTGVDIRAAIDATLRGESPNPDQRPSLGCNIKWKPGNEPDYFK